MEVTQSPTDPEFVQNPYPFYAAARAKGPLHYWADYNMMAAFSHEAVHTLLRECVHAPRRGPCTQNLDVHEPYSKRSTRSSSVS